MYINKYIYYIYYIYSMVWAGGATGSAVEFSILDTHGPLILGAKMYVILIVWDDTSCPD